MSKPHLPYVKGWKFKAYAHTPPPPPTPPERVQCPPPKRKLSRRQYFELKPADRCLYYPPLDGTTTDFRVDLTVRSVIFGGDDKNSQLVLVDLTGTSQLCSPMGRKLTRQMYFVAKFYDPLYFKEDGEEAEVPFLNVNRSFVQEVATYERLAHLQGVHIPKYFGSYTVKLPVDPAHLSIKVKGTKRPCRHVRLILIEHIDGKSMDKIPNPVRMFSQEDRKQAMKTIMETDMAFFTRNASNTDLADRNVMVTYRRVKQDIRGAGGKTFPYKIKTVALIDFGHVKLDFLNCILQPSEEGANDAFVLGTPLSPLTKWHNVGGRSRRFNEWIDWEWQPWLEAEYTEIDEATITPAVRHRLLCERIVKNCYSHEEIFHLPQTCFWTRRWYGHLLPHGSSSKNHASEDANREEDMEVTE